MSSTTTATTSSSATAAALNGRTTTTAAAAAAAGDSKIGITTKMTNASTTTTTSTKVQPLTGAASPSSGPNNGQSYQSAIPGSTTDGSHPAAATAAAAADNVDAESTAGNTIHSTNNTINNNNKRALLTHTKDGRQLSEKKLRRLEKNRLSARECRRRKREATDRMERQINILEGENLRLRLQLQIGEEAEETVAAEQAQLTTEIDALLKSGASETEIYAALESFKEKYADYGRDRRSAIEFHLRNIERLLMPTQTTSIVMRAIQGGEGSGGIGNSSTNLLASSENASVSAVGEGAAASSSSSSLPAIKQEAVVSSLQQVHHDNEQNSVHSSPSNAVTMPASNTISPTLSNSTTSGTCTDTDLPLERIISSSAASSATNNTNSTGVVNRLEPKALFRHLVRHLEVTPEQSAALKDSRLVAQELDGCLAEADAVLQELRNRLAQTGEDLETEFNNVRAILTPTQAAKFLVWVANNSACMHMLNELWDRVYPSASYAAAAAADMDMTMSSAVLERSDSKDISSNSP